MFSRFFIFTFSLSLLLPMAAFAQEGGMPPEVTVDARTCSGITDRMPVGAADSFAPDVEKVFLWCQITGAPAPTVVKHVWYYGMEEMASVELSVDASPWRTWSSKTIMPAWTGKWTVKILDAAGNELATVPFTIGTPE
jgi:hypothetical protein